MGVRNLVKRVTTPVEQLDRDRRRALSVELDCCHIDSITPRTRARVVGELRSVRMVPRSGAPTLEITIDDGHGRATAIFFGRKHLAGLAPGRNIVFDGTVNALDGRIVFYNPAYELR